MMMHGLANFKYHKSLVLLQVSFEPSTSGIKVQKVTLYTLLCPDNVVSCINRNQTSYLSLVANK
jgi:hypothetical protein